MTGAIASSRFNVYHPNGLRRWFAALGDAQSSTYKQPTITVVGDSIVQGCYANNAGTTDYAAWRTNGWVATLRNLFAKTYENPGEGYIYNMTTALNATYGEDRVAISASSASGTTGPQKSGRSIAAGQTLTLTSPVCTKLGIMGWWATGSSGQQFTYTIDGGAPITSAAQSGSDTCYIEWAASLAATTHSLVVSGPASGSFACGGFFAENGTGIRVHRISGGGGNVIGASASDFSAASQARVLTQTFVTTGTDLAIIEYRHNDANSVPVTPTLFQSSLQAMITKVLANTGCVLLIPDPAGSGTPSGGYPLSAYKMAMVNLANSNDHVSVLDIDDVWGGYANSNTLGLRQDTIHPNSRGHGSIASIIYDLLTDSRWGK